MFSALWFIGFDLRSQGSAGQTGAPGERGAPVRMDIWVHKCRAFNKNSLTVYFCVCLGITRTTRSTGIARIWWKPGKAALTKCGSEKTFFIRTVGRAVASSIIGGADIHIYVFTHHKNNRFQRKLIVQNTNIWISGRPPIIELATALTVGYAGHPSLRVCQVLRDSVQPDQCKGALTRSNLKDFFPSVVPPRPNYTHDTNWSTLVYVCFRVLKEKLDPLDYLDHEVNL